MIPDDTALASVSTLTLAVGAIVAGGALTLARPRDTRGTDPTAWLGAVLIGIGLALFGAGLLGGGA